LTHIRVSTDGEHDGFLGCVRVRQKVFAYAVTAFETHWTFLLSKGWVTTIISCRPIRYYVESAASTTPNETQEKSTPPPRSSRAAFCLAIGRRLPYADTVVTLT